jgi:hypothetical protein
MVEVKVKKEYENLDKNNFEQVCDLVDRIIEDICTTSEQETNPEWHDELKIAMMKDYMIDLINPDLLDFDSIQS